MNVIWIVADTLRQKDVGAYGNKTIHTPSIDALAAKSVRFNRHYAAGFPTVPARSDFALGRWTMSYMTWEPMPHDEITLAQILSKAGFQTAAIVDTPFFIRGNMNHDRGFQTFNETSGQNFLHPTESADVKAGWRLEADRFAPQTFNKAMQWLERHYKDDFFLYIDAWDPHEPWDAPNYYTELYWPEYDGENIPTPYGRLKDIPGFTEETLKKAHATYCGEITMVDTWLGYFLRKVENMQLMEKTAIIFTTDHGFYFGEHDGLFGKMMHARHEDGQLHEIGDPGSRWAHSPLYEELALCPLLIYVPECSPGVSNGLTSAIDLMPTCLDIFDIEIPARVEGQSLLPMMKDNSISGRQFVVTGFPFTNEGDIVRFVHDQPRKVNRATTTTVTTQEWSLLYSVEPGLSELFHLATDPNQKKNVISERPEVARELHQLLINFMRGTNVSEHLMKPRLELL